MIEEPNGWTLHHNWVTGDSKQLTYIRDDMNFMIDAPGAKNPYRFVCMDTDWVPIGDFVSLEEAIAACNSSPPKSD